MADVKISQLTALASASSDVAADVLAIVDTSVPQTKKITIENLLSPITIDKSAGTITSLGTVTGNVDFNGDLDVDGTANLDNTDIDGTLTVDGARSGDFLTKLTSTNEYGLYVKTVGTTSSHDLFKLVDNTGTMFSVMATGVTTVASSITQSSGTLTIKNASGDGSGLKIYQDTSDVARIYNHYNGELVFGVSNAEKLSINGNADVTIGTFDMTSPSTTYRNFVAGGFGVLHRQAYDAYVTSNTYYNSSGEFIAKYAHSDGIGVMQLLGGVFTFNTYSGSVSAGTAYAVSEKIRITSDGKLGIGTDSPGYQLDLRRNDTGTATSLGIRQIGSGDASMAFQTSTSPYGFCIGVDGSDSDAFKIATGTDDIGTNTKLTITTGGIIGIESGDSSGTGATKGIHIDTTGVPFLRYQETNSSGGTADFEVYVANGQYILYDVDDSAGVYTVNTSQVISGDFNDTSDVGLKQNIKTIDSGLSVVNKLNPVTFDWKNKKKGSNSGFIAQEVEKLLPDDVEGEDFNTDYPSGRIGDVIENEDKGFNNFGKSINMGGIVAHLTKAVQELSAKVKELEGK